MINVTIWNEFIQERESEAIRAVYPEGIHGCIGKFLAEDEKIAVRYAMLDQPEHGLTEEVLAKTDVLIWWGHRAHEAVEDEIVRRVKREVLRGMGLIALHSTHHSKIMKALLGTTLNLRWKHGERERLVCIDPAHPIAAGIDEPIELAQEEMYGEFFDIPKPDETVFLGWFSDGNVFRSGVTFTRGRGRIFYFQPGHEEYPIYYDPAIRKIIRNAVYWATPYKKLSSDYECTAE
ncbi:MAG: ThuA domain-containing protein [Bacteroides sp.]|nr:ThuA domain-containing protein [Roseburia sp.]MCM1461601.1 ThuA domain-containing protein [Bacteroides sp.]